MKSNINNSPIVYVVLTYDSLYDDYAEVDVHELLKGIPTICILNFIVQKFNKVIYSLTNNAKQRMMIHEMGNYIGEEPRKKLRLFLKKYPNVVLVDCYGTLMLEALALQNYTKIEEDDDSLDLCCDEYEAIYKALLYCNKRWTDLQEKNMKSQNVIDISLLMDLPIVEFKQYKDFETQLFKSIKFFEFCENDTLYSTYLQYFCRDHNVKNWQEYLIRIFQILKLGIEKPYIKVNSNNLDDVNFFDQYIINLNSCNNLWDNDNCITYFRDHFLVKMSGHNYMLLNSNLLIDKFYQGMKFDFFKTLKRHALVNSKGKEINNFSDFSSEIGTRFSEPYLLYSLMKKVFEGRADVIYTGEQLKSMGVIAEPDLYMRIGQTLFLIEYKDVILSDKVKFSADSEEMKKAILNRICKYDKGVSKKGVGQLYFTIENILFHGVFDNIDKDVKDIKNIFPIIMTTDRSFSALGVNLLVIEEFKKIMDKHPITSNVFISIPIIMDMDIIIKCANRLHGGFWDFGKMLSRYIMQNTNNLIPFNAFILENYLCNSQFDKENMKFLFTDFIDRLNCSMNDSTKIMA